MEEKARSEKDIAKLRSILGYFAAQPFAATYPAHMEFAKSYLRDAEHYHHKKDYFSSFGCANYAYGILEGVILKEAGKPFHEIGAV